MRFGPSWKLVWVLVVLSPGLLASCGGGGTPDATPTPEYRNTVVVPDAVAIGAGRLVGDLTLRVLAVEYREGPQAGLAAPVEYSGWLFVRLRAENATAADLPLPNVTLQCGGKVIGGPVNFAGEGALAAGTAVARSFAEGLVVFPSPRDCADGQILAVAAGGGSGRPAPPTRFSIFK